VSPSISASPSASGETIDTFLFADYPTINQIVAAIDAEADWTCTKHADLGGEERSSVLKITALTDCKAASVTLKAEVARIKSMTMYNAPYMRVKVLGLTGTPDDTLVSVRLYVR
jgi:hypothetical protein